MLKLDYVQSLMSFVISFYQKSDLCIWVEVSMMDSISPPPSRTLLLGEVTVVIHHFRLRYRAGMLHYGSAYRIDPLLLLLIRVRDEIHGLLTGGELESKLLVENILRPFDSEASGDLDDATGLGIPRNVAIFEPEKLTAFEDKPTATPRFDVFALFHEPSRALGADPEVSLGIRRGFALQETDDGVHDSHRKGKNQECASSQ